MRVARDQMRQSELEQLEGGPAGRATKPPVERCGRELYECFVFDESPQPRGSRLNLRIPFRVPKDDDEPLRAQIEQPCLEIERPAVMGELEEEAAPIAGQAEAAQLVRMQEL